MAEAKLYYAGIDVSKKWLDVAIQPADRTWRVLNDADGHYQLVPAVESCWAATNRGGSDRRIRGPVSQGVMHGKIAHISRKSTSSTKIRRRYELVCQDRQN
jgi:hypothetical protein